MRAKQTCGKVLTCLHRVAARSLRRLWAQGLGLVCRFDQMSPTQALLVKKPWASLLVSGQKTIELRGSATSKVGQRICIAESGSQVLVGEVVIQKCLLVAVRDQYGILQDVDGSPSLASLSVLHRVFDLTAIPYQKVYAWYVTDCSAYDTPVPYKHPSGAVIWMNLKQNRRKANRGPNQPRR